MCEEGRIVEYLEKLVVHQEAEMRTLYQAHDREIKTLLNSLAVSQAECMELKKALLQFDSRYVVNKLELNPALVPASVAALGSTYAPSSESPRCFFLSPPISPSVSLSSPFARPSAPSPLYLLGLDESEF